MGAFALASKSVRLLTILCLAVCLRPGSAAADPTLTTLYNFAGNDGAQPTGRLIFDKSGALYGTTDIGGATGSIINGGCVSVSVCGTVFKLTPPAKKDGVWTETLLHVFNGNIEGYGPLAGLIPDESGALYATTSAGPGIDDGTVFKLTPPSTTGDTWTATVLHSFTGTDGIQPYVGSLIFDESGALYGTTNVGGASSTTSNRGVVFKLMPPAMPGGSWTETVLHSFGDTGCDDGSQPLAGVIFDKSGALYGTTVGGGSLGCDVNVGTVFKLTPPAMPDGAWTETILHRFTENEGLNPPAGVIFDKSGALYGTTQAGALGYGTVFKLTPPAKANGVWTINVLHSFTQTEGSPSYGDLVFDKSGALYGATLFGGTFNHGTVFKLTPPAKADGVWTETILHSFTGNDGVNPYDGLILDKSGALYGTTNEGGAYGYGTVFKLATGMTFAGTPGKANCHGESVSALAQQSGGLVAAAAVLGYPSVRALQEAIMAYCEPEHEKPEHQQRGQLD
jgi:uncharacterized repeat protein (TIGR03803 family)